MAVHLMEIREIASMLNDKVQALVTELLPGGRREANEWCVGSIAGEPGRSMKIHLSGSRRGTWCDFSNNQYRGDALDLVAWVLFAGNKAEAIAWAKSWLGIDNMDPKRLKQKRAKIKADMKRREQEALEQSQKKQDFARRLWLAGKNIIGTPVENYLHGRGIDVRALSNVPGALRYLEKCKAIEDGEATWWPAMLGTIMNHEGEAIAVHRTYLDVKNGVVQKAPLRNAKKVLSSYAGGFIPLSRGASNRSFKNAPHGDHVLLCEGIEDGLSIAMACPEYRILACVSVSNFQNIVLPASITEVTIAADNDGDNAQASQALDNAVNRFMQEGRSVYITRSPVGKDFNDLLQQGEALIQSKRAQ